MVVGTKNTHKKQTDFLTEGRRDLLASCLVLITVFVLAFNVVSFSAKAYFALLVVDGIYLALLGGFIALFMGKSRSELLKNTMTFFGVVGAAISIYLFWAVFSFRM